MTTIHIPAPTPRRTIRFAPLPDPRRSVLVTDDGTELPLLSPAILDNANFDLLTSKLENSSTNASELASIPAAMSLSALSSPIQTPLQTPQSWNVSLPDVVSSPTASPASLPAQFEKTSFSESDSSNSSNNSSSASSSPPTSEISSSASSMYSLTPTQSIEPYPASTGSSTPTQPVRKSSSLRSKLSSKYNISTDQILTLGTINLFRRGSKGKDKEGDSDTDSIQSAQGWGTALTRWTSAGSGGPRSGRDGVGVPMYRTQSTQSYKGENVRNAKRSSSPASINSRNKPRSGSASSKLNPAHENGMLSTMHTGQSKKGTRMLNGRVYGAKRGSVSGTQPNPFANAKDDPDPEFVEWGYGGMGSVKNVQDGVGGTVWGRVLSNGTGVLDSGCPEKQNNGGRVVQTGGSRDDDDDGSGMGWVRKRREAREREAREKAEREAREQAEKEKQEQEAQDKTTESENNETDASDSRSFTSTTTTGTSGTATSASTLGNVRNIPAPLPLPDVGDPDAPSLESSGVGSGGSPTPTFASTMVTPTANAAGTPKPRAIEGVLSSPASPERNVASPDLRATSMSRQASNTPTISNLGGASSPGKDEQHHVMTAVNVPAPPPMSKHHSSHHSRGKSLQEAILKVDSNQGKADSLSDMTKVSSVSGPVADERALEDNAADVQQVVEEDDSGRSRKSRHASVSSTSSASSISSHSESGSDSESEKNPNDSDDEEEEEEEESEEEKDRKTSLGAGVEKISRHK